MSQTYLRLRAQMQVEERQKQSDLRTAHYKAVAEKAQLFRKGTEIEERNKALLKKARAAKKTKASRTNTAAESASTK